MRLGLAVLRLTVGGLFVGHGTQKLFGWFGGGGSERTGTFFEQLGLAPGRPNALAAGAAEAGGGVLLATGFLTPLGAMLTTSTMLTAIRLVHGKKGPWNTEGGYEYNLVLTVAALAIAAEGPGRLSLDALRGRERWGTPWALGALAGAAAGSALAVEAGRLLAATPNEQAPPTAPDASRNGAAPEREPEHAAA